MALRSDIQNIVHGIAVDVNGYTDLYTDNNVASGFREDLKGRIAKDISIIPNTYYFVNFSTNCYYAFDASTLESVVENVLNFVESNDIKETKAKTNGSRPLIFEMDEGVSEGVVHFAGKIPMKDVITVMKIFSKLRE